MSDQGITKFVQLADDSPQVPKLQKKRYADFKLTPNEWTNLDLLRKILKVLILALSQSVANPVNAAPRFCSTAILRQTRSHSFSHISNN
jgi:hypothetical protein